MGIFEWLFGKDGESDFSKDFIGKRGEFDRSDEDRYICEDMLSMKSQNPDADLEYHYGWENKLNYDGDGYEDHEDW